MRLEERLDAELFGDFRGCLYANIGLAPKHSPLSVVLYRWRVVGALPAKRYLRNPVDMIFGNGKKILPHNGTAARNPADAALFGKSKGVRIFIQERRG